MGTMKVPVMLPFFSRSSTSPGSKPDRISIDPPAAKAPFGNPSPPPWLNGETHRNLSSGPKQPNSAAQTSPTSIRERCDSMTPLGCPVVPDVYGIVQPSISAIAGRFTLSSAPARNAS